MSTHRYLTPVILLGTLLAPSTARAQEIAVEGGRAFVSANSGAGASQGVVFSGSSFEILNSEPLEATSVVKGSPFSADAITEFTQTLGDGNRIERSFKASIARDSRGRTRREEQVALVGPLAAHGDPPTLITLSDPASGLHYTFDDKMKVARRDHVMTANITAFPKGWSKSDARVDTFTAAVPLANQAIAGTFFATGPPEQKAVIENLGTQQIESVKADGTRTTTTIPAGAIGNQLPIDVVTERWFSNELQMAVLITRRDPRSGDTTYRLTNIVRAEPPEDFFTVPRDYRVEDMRDRVIEIEKMKKLHEAK